MESLLRIAVIVLLGIHLSGCATSHEPTAIDRAIAHVRTTLVPLDLDERVAPDAETQTYFDYYGLSPSNAVHAFGTFPSGPHQLAAHVFKSAVTRGTVVLVHGYYDHAGVWRNLLAHLLSQGYTVAILELPGHGLSSGERATIDDFVEYETALSDFIMRCRHELKGPLHVVAHSMGAGVTADFLLSGGSEPIDGSVVFLAPLIRPAHEWISVPARAVGSPFTSSVKRWFRRNSSDETFLAFIKNDPLHERHLPLSFCRAMRTWYKRMPDHPPSDRELLILQGTDDSTISWRSNLRFMQTKFPNATHVRIPKAGHQLVNESLPIREAVFEHVIDYLDRKIGAP